MGKALMNFRIEDDLCEKIKVYAELEHKSQAQFVNELIETAFYDYLLLRSGGMVAKMPNPQNMIVKLDEAEVKECTLGIKAIGNKFNKANLNIGLNSIANYIETRLLIDDENIRMMFQENLKKDSDISVHVLEALNK